MVRWAGLVAVMMAVSSCGTALAAEADLDARLAVTAAAIEQALARSDSMPGLVIGITDRQGLRKVVVHGFADVKARVPLTAQSRFAIGSVSKAFTAIALLQLAQERRFDVHAPITRYLPSLVIHSPFQPITGHDLLSHTAGLPNYLPDAASSRFAALELRDFTPTYAPGAHWWYSNTGFQLLGYALENIEHDLYPRIIRRRVLDLMGMMGTAAVIDDAQRSRMVVSYMRWPYDGSWVEAPWFEYSAGDGSLVADVADMSAYVRFILNRGMGDRGRVLSESAFAALTTPVLDDYAYGLFVKQVDHHTVIGHTGGIAGFHSDVQAHMDEGFGLVFLCNGFIDEDLKHWVVRAVAAAFEGGPLPSAPAPVAVPVPADYAGRFQWAGRSLEFVVENGGLALKSARGVVPLEKMGNDLFRVRDDAGSLPFVFERRGSKVTSVSQGAAWYAGEGFPESPRPAAPAEYGAWVGHFVNNGPEGPVARVFVRNGQLMMLLSEDEAAIAMPLTPLGPGVFRIGAEPWNPERARFDSRVDGRALRLFISGVPLYRKDTP